jgi:hypothetical protein
MVKVWPTLKDPEGRHIPEPGGDKGPNSQVGMTKHVMTPGSRKKREIQCVTNLAQTHNIEETVTRPPPKLEGTGNPEQYTTFDRTNGHRQIPFKEFGHAEPTQRRIDVLLVRKKCRGKSQNQPTSTRVYSNVSNGKASPTGTGSDGTYGASTLIAERWKQTLQKEPHNNLQNHRPRPRQLARTPT